MITDDFIALFLFVYINNSRKNNDKGLISLRLTKCQYLLNIEFPKRSKG